MRLDSLYKELNNYKKYSKRNSNFKDKVSKLINKKVLTENKNVKDKNILTQFQKIFSEEVDNHSFYDGSVRKAMCRMLNIDVKQGKSRDFIIKIGFSLLHNDNEVTDKVDFVDDLLRILGYTKLRASNEWELFCIYCLNNNLTYYQCKELYEEYTLYAIAQRNNQNINSQEDFGVKNTSTYYSDEILKLKKGHSREELFEAVFELSKSMSKVSILIQNELKGIHQSSNITAVQHICNFFFAFSSDCDNAIEVQKKLDQKYFNDENQLDIHVGGKYDTLFEYVNSSHLGYMKPFKNIWYVKTLYDYFSNAINGKQMLSREGYMLWLLFNGYSRLEIDVCISRRYEPLNSEYYFDRFVMMTSSFEIGENNTVVYINPFNTKNRIVIEDTDGELNAASPDLLRLSVIRCFTKRFNENFAAENFSDNSAVTIPHTDK